MSSTGVDRITGVDPSVAIKAPCGAASASNITLSGAQTIDGVAVTETTPKTRVLVTGQTSAIDNGIYDVYITAWVRSDDFNGSRDVVDGTLVTVDSGNSYSNSTWKVSTTNPISPGSTAIEFVRVNNFESAIQPIETIAVLIALTSVSNGMAFIVTSGYGQGKWVADSTAGTANVGTIVDSVGTAGMKFRRIYTGAIWAHWFNVARDGTDTTTTLQALRDYYAGLSVKPTLMFAEGTYAYTTSPNWAIQNSNIDFRGVVRLRNIGTGNSVILDSGATVALTFNMAFGKTNPPLVEGDASTLNGVFVRSVHHSVINANVRGCGSSSAAFLVNFAVCSEFGCVASVNQGAWYSGAQPLRGVVLDVRTGAEAVTACTFKNPIIEGVAAQGFRLVNADQCRFVGGTSEGNGGTNFEVMEDSRHNVIDGVDFEVSATSNGFIDRGRHNTWCNIYNDALSTFTSASIGGKLVDSFIDAVSNAGRGTTIERCAYGIAGTGGTITNSGLAVGTTGMVGNYNILTAIFDANTLVDFRINTGATIKKHISVSVATGAWSVPGAVPGISKKDSITLTGVVLGDTLTVGCASAIPEGYALQAVVTAADTISLRMYQLYGAAASPFPAGATFRIDAWGH